MSTTAIALVAENTVLLAGIAAAWHLLRQGGGLQVKTPPVPKRQAQPAADAGTIGDLSKKAGVSYKIVSSTMGQSTPATAAEGTGYYKFKKDPNWPQDRSAYEQDTSRAKLDGGPGSTGRKRQRVEDFAAALAGQGYDPWTAPPPAVREAGERVGVGYDTAREYRNELKRRSLRGGEVRDA